MCVRACVCTYTSTRHLSSGLSHQSQLWNRDWIDTSSFLCVCLACRGCLCACVGKTRGLPETSQLAMQEILNWCSKGKGIISSLLDPWHLRTCTSDINRPSVITSWTSSNCTLPLPHSSQTCVCWVLITILVSAHKHMLMYEFEHPNLVILAHAAGSRVHSRKRN